MSVAAAQDPVTKTEPGMKEVFIVVAMVWGLAGLPASAVAVATIMDDAIRIGQEAARAGRGLSPEDIRALVALIGSPWILLVGAISDAAVTLTAIWLFACRQFGKGLLEGLAVRAPSGRAMAVTLAVTALLVVGALFLPSSGRSGLEAILQTTGGLYAFLTIALIAPFVEEAYYRGFLLPILTRRFGSVVAIVVISVWFGAIHIPQLFPEWILIGWLFLLGLVLTLLRHFTGSLVPPLAAHALYNASLVAVELVNRFVSAD